VSAPLGEPYDWYQRGIDLLQRGDCAPAAILLARVLDAEPESVAALEGYARALFDCGRFAEAAEAFAQLAERVPDDDYAHFGLGSSLWRLQRFTEARDELAMALVMRPGRSDYARALQQVKATLRARAEADLPLNGPVHTEPRF
jgi:Flp pilus assembly protein TadD